jgi:hypothetical protein
MACPQARPFEFGLLRNTALKQEEKARTQEIKNTRIQEYKNTSSQEYWKKN